MKNVDKQALREVLEAHPEVEWILVSAKNEPMHQDGDWTYIFHDKYKPWLHFYAGWGDISGLTTGSDHYDALYNTVVNILAKRQCMVDAAYARAERLQATTPFTWEQINGQYDYDAPPARPGMLRTLTIQQLNTRRLVKPLRTYDTAYFHRLIEGEPC